MLGTQLSSNFQIASNHNQNRINSLWQGQQKVIVFEKAFELHFES